MFLKYEKNEDNIIVERRKRDIKQESLFMGVTLYTEHQTIGELEYEIDKNKFFGKNNLETPEMILNSKPFSNQIGTTVESMIALKNTIKLEPEEEATIELIIAISDKKEETLELLEKYKNNEKISNTFELSKARVEAESRYLGIKNTEIEIYQKILSYILYKNPIRKKYMACLPKRNYNQNELWQYGISGDKPIVLIKIKDQTEIEILEEIIQAYEYFKIKNVEIDLVILNEEEYYYESSLKREIENSILNKHLSYLIQNGIYILDNLQQQEIEMLEFKASLILDTNRGNLKTIMKEIQEESITEKEAIPKEENQMQIEQNLNSNTEGLGDIDKLKYYNEYGAFTSDGKEYIIRINKNSKLPTVWSHVIANEKFGTVVTETMGGYTWNKNSRLNRITAWNNNPNLDLPSEIIYLQNKENGQTWTMGYSVIPTQTDYYITYGFGYARYKQVNDGILQENEIFVPREEKIKINLIKLKNTTQDKKTLKIIYYNKPVLGEDEIKTNEYINLKYGEQENTIYAKSLYNGGEIAYISSTEKIEAYTGNKDSFIGKGSISAPEALNKTSLDNENSLGQSSCIAIQIKVELEAYESKEIALVLGQEQEVQTIRQTRNKYCNIENCKNELEEVKQYWRKTLNTIQIKTPLESMNIILNGWVIYQTLACRMWARTSFYQSGGAFGFRDQLQDTIALKFINPELMKQQILRASSHQFIEGDVEHWWHEEESRGIRTRFSDDLLWLCYLTAEYINFTGDKAVLDEETPYREGKLLEEGVDEEYDVHLESQIKGTLYEHCKKAIEKAVNFGENGLIKIGSGDWNDSFSTVGNKGKGESIWVTFFLYDVLKKFIPICEYKNDIETANKYREIQEKLRKALNTKGWDGRWYKRAYMDSGDALGSIENEECKIDSIAQSWSIISEAGDNDKKYISFESLEKYLVDQENGLIKLLTPAFDTGKLEPGYIKGYPAGVRENGGQYTHAAIWVVIATTILGFGNKALEYYRMINPIEHARTKQLASKYKVEPYVIAADVYSAGELAGRGGWTWYTGSSSWYYKAGIEHILGLKIENQVLKIEPCIPNDWKEYKIRYQYKDTIYQINIKNQNGKNTGVEKFILNGIEIPEKQIKLIDNQKMNEIEIYM